MNINSDTLKFKKFHDLVINGMDYEDAIKEVENLPDDYTLNESDRELFDILFKTEDVLNSIEKMPESSRPKKELEILSQKLEEIQQSYQSENAFLR